MWLSIVVWIIVGVANYFGHWLMQDKLDGFGMSILFMFGIAIIVCFEVALAIVMLWYLSANILVNAIVVLIAGAFLYDIWMFADFKETQFSMSQINNMVREEE